MKSGGTARLSKYFHRESEREGITDEVPFVPESGAQAGGVQYIWQQKGPGMLGAGTGFGAQADLIIGKVKR
jgi:hypothetical protein